MPFGIANGEMDGLVWRPADNVVHLVRLCCWERRKTVETKLFEGANGQQSHLLRPERLVPGGLHLIKTK